MNLPVFWLVGAAVTLLVLASDADAQRRPADFDQTVPGSTGMSSLFGFSSSPIPRTTVSYPGNHRAGTIVINTRERRLYLMLGDGQALQYGIGVGRDGFTWSGATRVSAKREWPDWSPPGQMLRRRPDLPRHMPGGPENPLGARALYLGTTIYRIHGTNQPQTIGSAVSSGCFRLINPDVIDLYERTPVGTKVIVRQRPEL